MRNLFLLEAEAGDPGNMLTMLIPFLLLGVVFYFFLIRPESKRKKATAKLLSELIVGDEVTTIGGIVGKIVQIKDDTVVVESGPERARVKIMRWGIKGKNEVVSDK